MNGRTDGQTDERMDGRTKERRKGRKNERRNELTKGLTGLDPGGPGVWTDEYVDGRTN